MVGWGLPPPQFAGERSSPSTRETRWGKPHPTFTESRYPPNVQRDMGIRLDAGAGPDMIFTELHWIAMSLRGTLSWRVDGMMGPRAIVGRTSPLAFGCRARTHALHRPAPNMSNKANLARQAEPVARDPWPVTRGTRKSKQSQFPRFWARNEGAAKKQSQFGPASRARGEWLVLRYCSSDGIDLSLCVAASSAAWRWLPPSAHEPSPRPAALTLPPTNPETFKQSQFPGVKYRK